MAIKLIRRHILLADAEASYGAGASLASGNAMLIENFTHTPAEQSTVMERMGLTGSLSSPKQSLVGRLASLGFDAEIKGSGTAGTPPEIGPLLRACGLEEAVNAGVDVSYKTSASAIASLAADMWDGGADRHQFVGARGDLGISLEAGTYAKANISLTAHPTKPAAQTRPIPTYDATEPTPLKQVTMTIGAYGTWEVYTAELTMNTEISAPPALTTQLPSGYSAVEITSYNPQIVVTMAAQDIADGYDPFDNWESGVSEALTIGPHGAAGNIFTINAPTATIINIATGDNEGRLTYEITYQLAESQLGANDNLNMVFT